MNRQKILVATDLSQKSDLAVEKAIDLSVKYDKWLEIIHAVDYPMFEICFGDMCKIRDEKRKAQRKESIEHINSKIFEKLQRKSKKMNVEVVVGSASKVIVEEAEKKEATIIVIGNLGERHGIEELVLGSTAKKVILNSKVPVLIVKNGGEYKNIAVFTDFSEGSKKNIDYIISLFPDSTITLVNIIEIPSKFRLSFYGLDNFEIDDVKQNTIQMANSNMQSLIEEFKDKTNIKALVKEGHFGVDEILAVCKELNSDLVSFDTDGSCLSRAFDIMSEVTSDVIVFYTNN
ncbi:MAG: universal stress protein [Campylobacterales bacterium]|nr:universal stress protein [Campylobacterales bacterium]